MVKCDKCGKTITGANSVKRYISNLDAVDLCLSCDEEIEEIIRKVEVEWFEGGSDAN